MGSCLSLPKRDYHDGKVSNTFGYKQFDAERKNKKLSFNKGGSVLENTNLVPRILENAPKQCPFSSQQKPYQLKNLLDGTSLFDTLHFKSLKTPCSGNRCAGSVYMPKSADDRPNGEPRPLVETKKHASDFIKEFYHSKNLSNSTEEQGRLCKIHKELETKGVYDLTTEELEFGTKLAWRNAPRCIGRIQWKKLKVFDCRHVKTASDMFQCLLEHLEYATNGGNIRSTITIFPPRTKFGRDFKIWNAQLLRYAGYVQDDGSIIGDPASVELTQVAEKLGWVGERTPFDILPWVLQANGEPPEVFEIPKELVLEVPITHPKYPGLNDLKLKWYAVPAVANMMFDCGGLEFTAAPFNGWYMATEVGARNFTDKSRYDMSKIIATKMNIDVTSLATLWRDIVMVELTAAVIYSYNKAGATMVDHQTASDSFIKHMKDETKLRGGCPADWVWIVPPISGSSTPVFHQEMLNYQLKPSYEYQPDMCTAFLRGSVKKITLKTMGILSLIGTSMMKNVMTKRHKVTILYASETGRSETFANDLNELFLSAFNSKVVCMENYDFSNLSNEECVIIVTSTFGNGEAPDNGKAFGKKIHQLSESTLRAFDRNQFRNIRYGVFGLGSSSYPHFCEFAKFVDRNFEKLRSDKVVDTGYGDELNEQELSFQEWKKICFQKTCKSFGLKVSIRNDDKKKEEPEYVLEGTDANSQGYDILAGLSKLHKKPVYPNTMLHRENLQSSDSGRVTNLIKLRKDVRNIHSMDYEPGDHVCIHAPNTPQEVSELLTRLNDDADSKEIVNISLRNKEKCSTSLQSNTIKLLPLPTSLERMFTWYLDITTPPSTQLLKVFAQYCVSQEEREKLLNIANDHSKYEKLRQEYYPSILETLNMFPSIRIPAAKLISYLPIIKPRYYSISSSQNMFPSEIHLTVALVDYTVKGGLQHKGVCTSFLDGLQYGGVVPSSIRRTNTFRLPSSVEKPFIMVGAGSGIAPFRSFWQERECQLRLEENRSSKADVVLVFGCRNPYHDDIFAQETNNAVKNGVISKVMTAYSRDSNTPKQYVQDVIARNTSYIVDLIMSKKGHVYVCGDVTMAAEVSKTIVEALSTEQNMSAMQAENLINELKENGMYSEDIFGVTFKAGQSS